jgi:alkaline phosphatase D
MPAGAVSSETATTAPLSLGPLVGAVTASSATIWVRTSQSARVTVEYGDPTQKVQSQTGADSDFTTKLQLTQLSPHTTYTYTLQVDGAPQFIGSLTTFPARGDPAPFRFVILTDFRTVSKISQPVDTFTSAPRDKPAFVILGGDFDHRNPTTVEQKREMFRDLYTPANGMQDFVELILHHFPLVHHWDDHDYGDNNADKTYPYKTDSLRVLDEYFPLYPITRYGDWQQFSYGDADFFVLDSRSQRSPWRDPEGPAKSMLDGDQLGAAGQRAWLLNGLQNSDARWKFIVSPVIFNPTTKTNDAWGAYTTERKLILDFIRTHQIRGVVVLSGDLHAGGIDDGRNSGLPEMVVPAANDGFDKRCLTEASGDIGKWDIGTFGDASGTPCNGYGVIDVTSDKVLLQVKDSQGKTRVSYTVP